MSEYRVYCFDHRGKISTSHEFLAADDSEALARTRAMKLETECELWNRDRLIAKIPPARPRKA